MSAAPSSGFLASSALLLALDVLVFLVSTMTPSVMLGALMALLAVRLSTVMLGDLSTLMVVSPKSVFLLRGFFHVTSSSTVLNANTSGYAIEGREGLWSAAEEMWIDGQNFLLMQSDEYDDEVAFAVLDSHGKTAAADTMDGFTDQVIEQIREYMHRCRTPMRQSSENVDKGSNANKSSTMASKNTTENTEAELTPVGKTEILPPEESAPERGRLKRDEKKEQEARQRRKKRRKKGKLPLKGRDSVLDRLKRYQEKVRKKAEAGTLV